MHCLRDIAPDFFVKSTAAQQSLRSRNNKPPPSSTVT